MDKDADNVDIFWRRRDFHPALITNTTAIKKSKAVNKPLPQSKYARFLWSSERNKYIPKSALAKKKIPFNTGNNSMYTDGSISVGEPSWFNRKEIVERAGI